MTTDALGLLRCVAVAAPALAAWFGVLGGVALVAEPTPVVLLLGPSDRMIRAAAEAGLDILDAPSGFIRARSSEPGFVRALYRSGAWFVLPSPDPGGCGAGLANPSPL